MPRYREEDGRSCVDVRVPTIENLFDRRDPAPFRERDLDPGLSAYLFDSTEDLISHGPPRLVFWLEKPCTVEEIEEPLRAHFNYELERHVRKRHRELREGSVTLVLAFALIALFISASQFVGARLTGTLGIALKEALIISGWVLLWRPVEVLLYDGIPWRRRRRVLRNLLAAPIDVRAAK